MREINNLVQLVFSGLSPLVIEDVVDQGELIWVRARTPDGPAACPGCGTESMRVHGYQRRTVADVPIDARRVVVAVRVRRLVCPVRGCVQTFREQVPGVLERYQRRTPRLTRQIGAVARELAGRAGARVLSAVGVLGTGTGSTCRIRRMGGGTLIPLSRSRQSRPRRQRRGTEGRSRGKSALRCDVPCGQTPR